MNEYQPKHLGERPVGREWGEVKTSLDHEPRHRAEPKHRGNPMPEANERLLARIDNDSVTRPGRHRKEMS